MKLMFYKSLLLSMLVIVFSSSVHAEYITETRRPTMRETLAVYGRVIMSHLNEEQREYVNGLVSQQQIEYKYKLDTSALLTQIDLLNKSKREELHGEYVFKLSPPTLKEKLAFVVGFIIEKIKKKESLNPAEQELVKRALISND